MESMLKVAAWESEGKSYMMLTTLESVPQLQLKLERLISELTDRREELFCGKEKS